MIDTDFLFQMMDDEQQKKVTDKFTEKLLKTIDDINFDKELEDIIMTGISDRFDEDFFYEIINENKEVLEIMNKFMTKAIKKAFKMK